MMLELLIGYSLLYLLTLSAITNAVLIYANWKLRKHGRYEK